MGRRLPDSHVVFAFFRCTWDHSRRRGGYFAQDRLATALLARDDVERLAVADAPRSALAIALDAVRGRSEPFPASEARHRVRIPALTRLDPTRPALVRAAYRAYGAWLGRAVARAGLDRPVTIVSSPFLAAHGELGWAGPVTLYVTDDYASAPSLSRWHPALQGAARALRDRGTSVAAVSQPILDRLAPTGPGLVVPNGIEADEWRSPDAPPAWLRRLPRPWLVYTGGLDDRVDPAALAATAEAVPGASIVLVGLALDPGHIASLRAIPGVEVHPPVGRKELAAVVSAADVCLVPHRRTTLTEAMSPIKLYEYLAAGRTVVATDLAPVRGLGERVLLAAGPAAFGAAVRAALELPPLDHAARTAFIAANSWPARHSELLRFARR